MAECGLHGRVVKSAPASKCMQCLAAHEPIRSSYTLSACAHTTLCPDGTNLRALSMRLATQRRLGVHVNALCAAGADVEAAAALEARASCMAMDKLLWRPALQLATGPHTLSSILLFILG